MLALHHHRCSIRLKGYDYSQSGAYFVTIRTYQYKPLFGAVVGDEMVFNSFGQVVWEEWFKSARIRSEFEFSMMNLRPCRVSSTLSSGSFMVHQ
jgi:hypothetical protein